jgi:hypothetical protein
MAISCTLPNLESMHLSMHGFIARKSCISFVASGCENMTLLDDGAVAGGLSYMFMFALPESSPT